MIPVYIMEFYGYYLNPTYILIIIGVIICIAAGLRVKSTFKRYDRMRSWCGMTGAQVAELLLQREGIYDVAIHRVSGNLTDHYDSKNKILSLSERVYDSNSVAAISVAAHECGHAIQHQVGYAPSNIRDMLYPVAQFGADASWLLILLGIFLSAQPLLTLGIIVFSFAVLFQIATLPVEFNASSRALKALESQNILYGEENRQARRVLFAGKLSYVAGAAVAILQLLRLVILYGGRRND